MLIPSLPLCVVDQKVFVRFEKFLLELPYSGMTCYDAVTIYDGPDVKSERVGIYCGKNTPSDILASTNVVYVTFKSDRSTASTGFVARYSEKAGTGYISGNWA